MFQEIVNVQGRLLNFKDFVLLARLNPWDAMARAPGADGYVIGMWQSEKYLTVQLEKLLGGLIQIISLQNFGL